jgi:excisionase family DNA binding protein
MTPPLAGALAPLPNRALYSVQETQTLINVSHATIYRLFASGRLAALKVGARTMVPAESIARFLDELPKAACAR